MAVMDPMSGVASVTSSAVDFDPNPLGPADPIRYRTVSSISNLLLSFFPFFLYYMLGIWRAREPPLALIQ